MNVQPLEGALSTPFPIPEPGGGGFPLSGLDPAPLGSDAISRSMPPWMGGSPGNPLQTLMFGPLGGLIAELMQLLQNLMGQTNGSGAPGGEQYFNNATGGSVGDPHLSFNGAHWNSMTSHPDLLHSDSIPGGFRISTQVTPPNQNGVAWNQSATIALNNGASQISLNDEGQPSITNYGQPVQIATGQTVQLGNGASVTRNANGSLSVLAQSGTGGQIATTLTAQGKGVNVEVNAQNVDLGGALVRASGSHEPHPPVDPTPLPILQMPQIPPFPLPFAMPLPNPQLLLQSPAQPPQQMLNDF